MSRQRKGLRWWRMRSRRAEIKTLFGTDGVRGIANEPPMTVEIVTKLGKALGYVLKKKDEGVRHKVVIGKDTRLSGYMFETSLSAGLCSMGVDVLLVGPHPTPGIAFLTQSLRADAGIVISASHNLFEDNGIKIFGSDGYKLPDKKEKEIEEIVLSGDIESLGTKGPYVGKAFKIGDALGRYIVFLKNSFPKEMTLQGFRIVIDCANGAAYKLAPMALEELGADVIPLNVKPNGKNINFQCGSTNPGEMREAVKNIKVDLGIALDGDGDRAIFSDENGEIVFGDEIIAICATNMAKEKLLKKNTVVTTEMTNIGFDIAMKKIGVKVKKVQVGDRYVVEEMVRGGYNLGGEQSGHIIFHDFNTTGDGIITALQVLSVMIKSGRKLSDLKKVMKKFPQVLVNVRVKEKKELSYLPRVQAKIEEVKVKLNGKGRVFVRYSGTEPVARVMVEGEDGPTIGKMAGEIAQAIRDSQN